MESPRRGDCSGRARVEVVMMGWEDWVMRERWAEMSAGVRCFCMYALVTPVVVMAYRAGMLRASRNSTISLEKKFSG